MTVIDSKLSWLDKSELRIVDLIKSARRKFLIDYPDQNFNASVWSISHLCSRPTADKARHLIFTKIGSNFRRNASNLDHADALPAYVANVLKSWIIQDGPPAIGSSVSRLDAARHFWRFLSTQQPERATVFRWGSLTEDDFLAFELHLKSCQSGKKETLSPDTIIGIINQLQQTDRFPDQPWDMPSYLLCCSDRIASPSVSTTA